MALHLSKWENWWFFWSDSEYAATYWVTPLYFMEPKESLEWWRYRWRKREVGQERKDREKERKREKGGRMVGGKDKGRRQEFYRTVRTWWHNNRWTNIKVKWEACRAWMRTLKYEIWSCSKINQSQSFILNTVEQNTLNITDLQKRV